MSRPATEMDVRSRTPATRFDELPLFRRSDPPESRAAARRIAPKLGDLHRWAIDVVRRYPGRTATELTELAGELDPRRLNRRLGELAKLGRLRRGQPRPCRITDRRAATWYVAEGGAP